MRMHRFGVAGMLLAVALVRAGAMRADATRQDWVGNYTVDYDGHPGSLRVEMAKCASPCAGLKAEFVDGDGVPLPTTVEALDDNGQHLSFSVAFPGNQQHFDLYLFSFDKRLLAGTTVWQSRTFGVSAMRSDGAAVTKAADTAAPLKVSGRRMTADGSVVDQKSDGSTRSHRLGQCGGTFVIHGKVTHATCDIKVNPLVPPPDPDPNSSQGRWLRGQDDSLLAILQAIMDSTSYQNYLSNYENPPDPAVYKQVYYRIQAIADYTAPQQ